MVSRLMLNLHEHADVGILTDLNVLTNLNGSIFRDVPLEDITGSDNRQSVAVSRSELAVDSQNVSK